MGLKWWHFQAEKYLVKYREEWMKNEGTDSAVNLLSAKRCVEGQWSWGLWKYGTKDKASAICNISRSNHFMSFHSYKNMWNNTVNKRIEEYSTKTFPRDLVFIRTIVIYIRNKVLINTLPMIWQHHYMVLILLTLNIKLVKHTKKC